MSVLESQLSFAAGEISKALWARRDLAKRQIAVKRAENVVVMLEGGLTRAPGTRYVANLKNEARAMEFVPFRFSRTDAYMLVINGGVIRFYLNGGVVEVEPGVPLEVTIPWPDAQLPNLRWQGVADSIYFVCPGFVPRILKRVGATTWTLTEYLPTNPPLEPQNLDESRIITASAATGSLVLTASHAIFNAGHQNTTWRLDETSLDTVALWQSGETVAVGNERRWQGRVYRAMNNSETGPNPPVHDRGDQLSGLAKTIWRFVHAGYGYVKITSLNSATSANGVVVGTELPLTIASTGTYRWYEAGWSGERGYPEHVAQLDQALLFGRKDTGWRTRPGDFYDFEIDATEHSALIFRLGAPDGELPNIEWLKTSGVIVAGCTGSEWIIRGSSPFDALTIANIKPVQSKQEGSSKHRPVMVDGGVISIGLNRRDLFFCQFSSLADDLDVQMVTKFARHILKGRAMGLAYQRNPHRIVWAWCADGSLRALTFRPTEDTMGWTRRPMVNGFVECAGVVPTETGERDEVWLIVRRIINGVQRRYIEVMQGFFEPFDEDEPDATGAWFLDCALGLVAEAPVTVISGLAHLEGQQVAVFADGAMQAGKTVAGGTVTLDQPAQKIIVGLPQHWAIKLLPIDSQDSKTLGKRAPHVTLDLVDSAGGYMSVNGGDREPLQPTGGTLLGTAIALTTGPVAVNPAAPTETTLSVEMWSEDALPFTLSAVNVDIDARRA